MLTEIEILQAFIKRDFKTKENFAKHLGMTRQNLSHHTRAAVKNNNIFGYDFKAKLLSKNIKILGAIKPIGNDYAGNYLKEDPMPYGTDIFALNKIIKMQEEKIWQLENELAILKGNIGKTA